MSVDYSSEQEPKKDQGKNIIIIVLALLIIISGVKLYLDHQDKSKKSEEILLLSSENSELNKRLDSVFYQLELRIQEIEKLGGDLENLEEIRAQLLAERQASKQRNANEIAALNSKINEYNSQLQAKDQEILELRAMNQQLFSENQDLKNTQAQIEQEVAELNLEKENLQSQIDVASRLSAENIVISAINRRGKERVETDKEFKNRQIERIRVSFNLADNKIAQNGPRNVFVQILDPNGQPIFDVAKGSGTFMLEGVEEFFTVKQDIIFDNSGEELSFFYEKGSDYLTGEHEIRIYVDDYQVGNRTFSVK